MTPALARLDEATLTAAAERLARTGRTRVADILSPAYADHLLAAAGTADYAMVAATEARHLDMPAAWLGSLDVAQKTQLGQAFQARGTHHFGYLYDALPIFDQHQAGAAEPVWAALVDFINGDAFLDLMRRLTGEPRIAMADAQVTRYRRGHFLTRHDDHSEGKNRYFAYVLNLSPGWIADWGGLLAFPDDVGDVAEAFTPRFNTLNLLRVPSPHLVTQVALFAGADRISVTGWLRGA